MIVIVCVDDNKGMMFHNRRQSQDRLLRDHIISFTEPHNLWMSVYSVKQFTDTCPEQIIADDAFLEKAQEGDYCFVEDMDISPYMEKIEKIILFHWNRQYPADVFFTFDFSEWTLEAREEFAGYSHEKITKEVYRK